MAAGGNTGGFLQVEDIINDGDMPLVAPGAALATGRRYSTASRLFDAKNLNGIDLYWPGFGQWSSRAAPPASSFRHGIPTTRATATVSGHTYSVLLNTANFARPCPRCSLT